ncbi:cubilin-like isoform X1 [Haliotis rufescens]|uniref:cubilin-like isoform X1 n=1 Tax=Haliotis rufescens TaxID=6454 RepID=UPI00201EB55F|nr:cubilin-like isoform X1 [Haliotis rufescens]
MFLRKYAMIGLLLVTLVYLSDAGTCNWEIDATEAVRNLTIPGLLQQNESCWWRVHAAEEGHHVVIEVMNPFNVTGCLTATLSIYDGWNSSDALLAEICANERTSIISSGRTLYLYLDKGYTVTRILIQVYAVPQCGGQLKAMHAPTNLTSPGYPQHYSRNFKCSWTITTEHEDETVILQMMDVDIEQSEGCENASITMYNSNSSDESLLLGRLCGREPYGRFLQSSKNTLKIEFITKVFGSGMYKGFKLQYHSVSETNCNFTNVIQGSMPSYIYSPGYPSTYYNDLDCVWKIVTISRDAVLEVVDSELEGSPPSCSKDSVTVYEGMDPAMNQVGKFCGSLTPNFTTYLLTTVKFKTNTAVVKKGFRMKYYAIKHYIPTTPAPDCGPQNLTAVRSDQHLVSPGYPVASPSNLDCQWTITSSSLDMMVRIEILDSELQNNWSCDYGDKVYVYDGPDNTATVIQIWCGHMKPVVQSSDTSLTLRFVTGVGHGKGFKLKYTETRESLPCGGQVSVTNSSGQYLYSPGYPANYRRNMKCVWVLRSQQDTSIKIHVQESSVGDGDNCADSYVSVSDGANDSSKRIGVFCGKKQPTFISSGHVMSITLNTGAGSVKKGFVIKYTSGSFHNPYDCGGRLLLNSSFYRLRPPGYYTNYYFDMKCVWVIESNHQNIRFSIDSTGLMLSPSCKEEYITINDGTLSQPSLIGRFCGYERLLQYYVTSGKVMVVTFQSREPNNVQLQSGFDISLYGGDFEICKLQEQKAWDSLSYITSPNFPFNYPRNAHCSWRIDTVDDSNDVVMLTVISFNITKTSSSCDSNYLEAFDGYDAGSPSLRRWCGTAHDNPVIYSTGRYLFIKFDTSNDTPNTGFNISIHRSWRSSVSESRNHLIIGLAVGVPAGVFLVVAVSYYAVRKAACFNSGTISHRTNLRPVSYKHS